jgi:hypothetical protein
MHRLIITLSIFLILLSFYFLSSKEESWSVNKHKSNTYVNDNGKTQNEVIPVVVEVKDSSHDLGYGLLVIGCSFFLSGIYLYSIKHLRQERI